MTSGKATVLCGVGAAVTVVGIIFLAVLLTSLATGEVLSVGSAIGCAIVVVGLVLIGVGVQGWTDSRR